MPKDNDQLLVVIDLGSTGNRSIVFNIQGEEIAKAYREFPTVAEEPGQAEQDAEDWWQTTCVTMKEVLTHSQVSPKNITAVSVSAQRASMVPLDKKSQPLALAPTWMDGRFSPSEQKFEEQVKRRSALRRALWIKDTLPKVFAKTNKLADPEAFLHQRLTGVLGSDLTQHSFGLLDPDTWKLSEELGELVDVPVSLWPEIVDSGSVLGEVTAQAAKETGLPAGTPVIVGGGDQQCSVLGLGVLEKGIAKATIGTGTFIVTPVDKRTLDPMGLLFCHPHVLPDQWVLEGVLPDTGMILRWFRDQFGHIERAVAERVGRDPYEYICEEARLVSPGSDGLLLFPFFVWSLGLFQGIGFQHTRAHIARAILESVAFVARFLLDTMFSVAVHVEELRLDGGGARSDLWRQIHCDITGKKAIYTKVDEGTALGAAILSAVGCNHYNSIEKAVEAMVSVRQVHAPNKDNEEIYTQRYLEWQQILMSKLPEIVKHI